MTRQKQTGKYKQTSKQEQNRLAHKTFIRTNRQTDRSKQAHGQVSKNRQADKGTNRQKQLRRHSASSKTRDIGLSSAAVCNFAMASRSLRSGQVTAAAADLEANFQMYREVRGENAASDEREKEVNRR